MSIFLTTIILGFVFCFIKKAIKKAAHKQKQKNIAIDLRNLNAEQLNNLENNVDDLLNNFLTLTRPRNIVTVLNSLDKGNEKDKIKYTKEYAKEIQEVENDSKDYNQNNYDLESDNFENDIINREVEINKNNVVNITDNSQSIINDWEQDYLDLLEDFKQEKVN